MPWVWVFFVLYLVVFGRSYLMYWVARGLVVGATSTNKHIAKVVASDAFKNAEKWIATWGPPVVSFCFLTVGLQSAVLLSSGIGRMPQRKFIPALAIGSVFWALIYSTVGFFGVKLVIALWEYSVALTLVMAATLVAAITFFIFWRKRTKSLSPQCGLDSQTLQP